GSASFTNVVVDVEGYYLAAGAGSGTGGSGTGGSGTGGSGGSAGATYVPMSPARIVDTRCSESPLPASLSASYCAALPTANASLSSPAGAKKIHVQVTGVGGVPDTGVAAVLVNLTFAGSFATGGYLSAYPTGSGATTGEFSNLNWSPATYQGAVANLAVVEVGAGGDITIYNGSASFTNVVVDVEGYYLSG
ncbi:MAG: hypothetical protein M1522_05900, partial [Actinobacteria bacterium]|nr:hypothetical protein [Actinomycetota bacterium]